MFDSLGSDDFEPRNEFPLRPANAETVPIPSVPEVSIISDQPLQLNLPVRQPDQTSYQAWHRKNYIPEKPIEVRQPQFSPDYNQFDFSPTNVQHQREPEPRELNSPRPRYTQNQQEYEKSTSHIQNRSHHNHSLKRQSQNSPRNFHETSQSSRHQSQVSQGQRQGQDCQVEDCDCSQSKNNSEPRIIKEVQRRPVTYKNASPQNHRRNLSNLAEFEVSQGHGRSSNFEGSSYQSESCRSVDRWKQSKSQGSSRDSCSCSDSHYRSCNSGTRCCDESYKTGESSETVRNLLVLVHSLSEQMKCLQMQVDRLFKIHEENLEERRNCHCKSNRCREPREVEVQDSRQVNERQLRMREDQGVVEKNQEEKGTFLEQKVSIGVMTSFEFKVQNNQQVDKEIKELRDKAKRLAFQEGFETRKKQSLISRKPNGLENINEDIESQSRSGNFNLTNERQSPENYQAMEDSYRSHRNDYVRDRPSTKGLGEVDPRKTSQNCRLQNKNFETPERCPRKNNGQNETIIYNNDKTLMNNEDSDEESNSPANHTPNVGWTFYNNVLGQVNQILKNSAKEGREAENEVSRNRGKRVDFVKAATLEQMAKMGITSPDEDRNNSNRNANLEAMRYQKLQADMINAQTNAAGETNTSMKMQALAMKYLDDNELAGFAEFAIQKQQNKSWKQMMNNGDENNFSIATMKYLQKYQILPEFQQHFQENEEVETDDIPRYDMNIHNRARPVNMEQRPALNHVSPAAGNPNRILDFSALKNRPKLR